MGKKLVIKGKVKVDETPAETRARIQRDLKKTKSGISRGYGKA